MKRLFDIMFSIIGLCVFCIPMAIVSVLIKVKERHPVLFKQTRIGKDMRPFTMLKIQTMVDEQVTPIGKIIRSTGLDEIPQFINVLKGDMSIVGPRALTIDSIRQMKWDDGKHNKRWSVKPGITGFAQMTEKYQSDNSYKLDCDYIDKSNVLLDFALLCVTFGINIFGKKRVLKVVFGRDYIDQPESDAQNQAPQQ